MKNHNADINELSITPSHAPIAQEIIGTQLATPDIRQQTPVPHWRSTTLKNYDLKMRQFAADCEATR